MSTGPIFLGQVYSIMVGWRHLPDRYENHGEYKVLSQEGHNQGRRRDDLDDQQEEHVETNQYRD